MIYKTSIFIVTRAACVLVWCKPAKNRLRRIDTNKTVAWLHSIACIFRRNWNWMKRAWDFSGKIQRPPAVAHASNRNDMRIVCAHSSTGIDNSLGCERNANERNTNPSNGKFNKTNLICFLVSHSVFGRPITSDYKFKFLFFFWISFRDLVNLAVLAADIGGKWNRMKTVCWRRHNIPVELSKLTINCLIVSLSSMTSPMDWPRSARFPFTYHSTQSIDSFIVQFRVAAMQPFAHHHFGQTFK